MNMTIYTNNAIEIDGQKTGLGVCQTSKKTLVYTMEIIGVRQYAEHKMPNARYTLAADTSITAAPGRVQFEADIRSLIKTLG